MPVAEAQAEVGTPLAVSSAPLIDPVAARVTISGTPSTELCPQLAEQQPRRFAECSRTGRGKRGVVEASKL
eukprot:5156289-Pleurochrysis_carterae.AAC.3